MTTLGDRIRSKRIARKLSQQFVARQMGVKAPSVAQWESGRSRPDLARLPKLAEILGCPLTDLLEPQDDPRAIIRARIHADTARLHLDDLELVHRLTVRLAAEE